jgi:hypothetical protein
LRPKDRMVHLIMKKINKKKRQLRDGASKFELMSRSEERCDENKKIRNKERIKRSNKK